MKIESKEKTEFELTEVSKDLFELRVILGDAPIFCNINLWLFPSELEQLKDVINI